MKTKYLIKDLKDNTYFLGSSPKPVWGSITDGVNYFKEYKDAENRLNEEIELFGSIFEGMVIEIIKVYIW